MTRPRPLFAYDHENRLIEATVNGVTSTYQYNGDGLRVSRTADGATTEYVWDPSAGSGQAPGSALPVILQETAVGGGAEGPQGVGRWLPV